MKTEKLINIIIGILIGLLFVFILTPFANLIYSQDALSFFIFPLTNTNNPLFSFVSHGGKITIFYSAQLTFLDAFEYIIQRFGINLEVSERIFIIFTIVISNLGLLTLLDLVFSPQLKQTSTLVVFKILSLLLYWLNPFTLTVTLWHYLAWFIFQAILPYIFIVIYLILYNRLLDFKLWLSVLIIFFFSPGTFGSYSAVLFFIYIIASFFLLSTRSNKNKLKSLLIQFSVLILTFLIESYFYLSYLIIYKFLGQFSFSNLTGGAESLASLITIFKYQSITTSFVNVIRLMGFSYIYTLPSSYPWMHLFSIVAIGSFFIPILFILSYLSINKRSTIINFFLTCSVISIIFSVGLNFPFGNLDLFLLKIGGPFYILTNAYYFVIEIYLLSGILFFYGATDSYNLVSAKEEKGLTKRKTRMREKLDKLAVTFNSRVMNIKRRKILFSVIALIILLTSVLPVMDYGEYSQEGPMIGSFKLPSDFIELRNYFEKNFSMPDYYVLILPLSRVDAVDLKFGNGTLPDSSNLFQSLIPYPVIDWALSEEDQKFDNLLTSLNSIHIVPILMAMHVKYVVLNPYFNESSWWMNSAPNGLPIQIANLTLKLNDCISNTTHIGKFTIYRINNVMPIASIYTEPDFLQTNNLSSYFDLLSHIKYANNSISNLIVNSIPNCNNTTDDIKSFHVNPITTNIIQLNQISELVGIPEKEGKLNVIGNYSENVNLTPFQILAINSSVIDNYSNFFNNGTSFSTIDYNTSHLDLGNTSFHVGTFLNGTIRFNYASDKYGYGFSYFDFYSSLNGTGFYVQFLIDTIDHVDYLMFSLYYLGLNLTQRVSWGSIEIPSNLTNTTIPFLFMDSLHSLSFTITIENQNYSLQVPINPVIEMQNEGINESLAQRVNSADVYLNNYSFCFDSVHANLTLNKISFFNVLNYSYIISVPVNILKNRIIQPASFSLSKGYVFCLVNGYNKLFSVFFASPSPLIKIKPFPGGSPILKLNSNYVNLYVINNVTPFSVVVIVNGVYGTMLITVFVSVLIFIILVTAVLYLYINRRSKW